MEARSVSLSFEGLRRMGLGSTSPEKQHFSLSSDPFGFLFDVCREILWVSWFLSCV